ncbi:MAG: hypothetical protein GF344_12875 [Chitinivibrionales bacterium]|nr:hypothetical protein [Chitinivibrionales bacterium]MBD3357636.1 hypothetical protein [Chitinivibrionales bacterium]
MRRMVIAVLVTTASVTAGPRDSSCTPANACAKETSSQGTFTVQGEFYPMESVDVSSRFTFETQAVRTGLFGIRYYPSGKFGFDVLAGVTCDWETEMKEIRSVRERPAPYAIQGRIGFAFRLAHGERASLWGTLQCGGVYRNRVLKYNDRNSGKLVEDNYHTFTPMGVFRIEPTLSVNNRLAFYTTLGVQALRMPAAKEIKAIKGALNSDDGAYEYEYVLEEKGDVVDIVALDALSFGARLRF